MTYIVAKCSCAPGCWTILKSEDDGPYVAVARADTERDAHAYIRSVLTRQALLKDAR